MRNDKILTKIKIDQELQSYTLQYPDFSMIVTSGLFATYSKKGEIIPDNYSAVSNVCFVIFDYICGIWGQAAGIGKNEKEALEMCIKEINQHVRDTHYSEFNKRKMFMTSEVMFSYEDLKPIETCKRVVLTWDFKDTHCGIFIYYQKALDAKKAKQRQYEYISNVNTRIGYGNSIEEIISEVLQQVDPEKLYKREVPLSRLKNQNFYSTDRFFFY